MNLSLQDALYNWLTIKVVVDARPNDEAAVDTFDFFQELITNDHKIEKVDVQKDDDMYLVYYWIDGEKQKKKFPIEMIDCLLDGIKEEPTYKE